MYSSVCVHLSNASTKRTHGTTKLIDYVVDESFIFEIFKSNTFVLSKTSKYPLSREGRDREEGGWKKDEGNFLVRGIKMSEVSVCRQPLFL